MLMSARSPGRIHLWVTPAAIATTFIRGRIRSEERNPISRVLVRVYDPICRFALRFRWPVIIGALVLIVVTIPVVKLLGSEFMPPLNEGDLMFMPIADPSISLEENTKIAIKQNAVLMSFRVSG